MFCYKSSQTRQERSDIQIFNVPNRVFAERVDAVRYAASIEINYHSSPFSNFCRMLIPEPWIAASNSISLTLLASCFSSAVDKTALAFLDDVFVGVMAIWNDPVFPLTSLTRPRVSRLATTSRNSVAARGCKTSSLLHKLLYCSNSCLTVDALPLVLDGVPKMPSFPMRLCSMETREQRAAFCCKFRLSRR